MEVCGEFGRETQCEAAGSMKSTRKSKRHVVTGSGEMERIQGKLLIFDVIFEEYVRFGNGGL